MARRWYTEEIGRGFIREVDPSIKGRQMEEVRVLVEVEDLITGSVVGWEIKNENQDKSVYVWPVEDGWTRESAQKVFKESYEEVTLA